jgi:hypothetical protein
VALRRDSRRELQEGDVPDVVTDTDAVLDWRLDVLLRVGYPLTAAEWLAKSDADLHEAVELLQQGCPPYTAVRILK